MTSTAEPLLGNVLGSFGDDFVIAEWQDPGGPPGPPRWIAPLHIHHSDDEAWYVLEGALIIKSGEEEIEARQDAAVLIKRGTPHTYRNPGPGRVRYLLIMTSNIHGLITDLHSLKDRTPTALKEVFFKHDSELL